MESDCVDVVCSYRRTSMRLLYALYKFTTYLLTYRFNIDELTGAVTVAVDADVNRSLLDRESRDVVDVVVVARDAHNHSSTTQLAVRLTDLNENRPLFRPEQTYVGVIDENSLSFVVPVTVAVRHQLRVLVH